MEEPFALGPLTAHGRDLALELVALAYAGAPISLGEQQRGMQVAEECQRAHA